MTAPAIPLCPLPDAHPTTCPCPRRTGETYYGQPITTTRDISSYRDEQHVTDQPTFLTSPTTAETFVEDIEEAIRGHLPSGSVLPDEARIDIGRAITDLISIPCFPCRYEVEGGDEVGQLHPACQKALYGVGPCGDECSEAHAYGTGCEQAEYAPPCDHRCNCGHDQADHSARYCGRCQDPCNSSGHYPDDCDRTIPDAASQSRTTPDNPAASGDTADNQPWRWAETIAAHGIGATYTIDIDAEHPGGDQITIECTLTQASELNAMLTDAINEGTPNRPTVRLASTDDALTGQVQPSGPNLEFEAESSSQVEDGELTAEEARNLADRLSIDLYRAQDALDFVEECCIIADREGRPVTTALVRQWLLGPQCGRQLLAGSALPARAQAAIRALEQQRDGREAQLAEARETNRRLNYRCQQAEHIAAVFKRAVDDWEWTDKGTYVPLRTLTAIAKAVGLEFDAGRFVLHYQRVDRLEAAVAAVRQLADRLDRDAEGYGGGKFQGWQEAARDIRAALDPDPEAPDA